MAPADKVILIKPFQFAFAVNERLLTRMCRRDAQSIIILIKRNYHISFCQYLFNEIILSSTIT